MSDRYQRAIEIRDAVMRAILSGDEDRDEFNKTASFRYWVECWVKWCICLDDAVEELGMERSHAQALINVMLNRYRSEVEQTRAALAEAVEQAPIDPTRLLAQLGLTVDSFPDEPPGWPGLWRARIDDHVRRELNGPWPGMAPVMDSSGAYHYPSSWTEGEQRTWYDANHPKGGQA